MAWVVDTCVVIDVSENDPDFGLASAQCLNEHLDGGLVVCPVTVVELAPAFDGSLDDQRQFFQLCGLDDSHVFTYSDAEAAHKGWNAYVQAKRLGKTRKRPVADCLIGGFALRFQGLITRNPKDFQPWYPGLPLVNPAK